MSFVFFLYLSLSAGFVLYLSFRDVVPQELYMSYISYHLLLLFSLIKWMALLRGLQAYRNALEV